MLVRTPTTAERQEVSYEIIVSISAPKLLTFKNAINFPLKTLPFETTIGSKFVLKKTLKFKNQRFLANLPLQFRIQ